MSSEDRHLEDLLIEEVIRDLKKRQRSYSCVNDLPSDPAEMRQLFDRAGLQIVKKTKEQRY